MDQTKKLTFREFVDVVNPKYKWYRHCIVLADVLERVARGELTRVMIFMPPRHGKSELVSRLFTAYYLYLHPDKWVGVNSYAAELAYTFSRAARDHYRRAGGKLKGDAATVKHWETGLGGGFWAAGVGGPITGKGFHLGVIDDPLKNADAGESEKIRARQKDWYDSTFYTREEPGGAIIIMLTRWNVDDLAGWQLASEDEEPEHWHVVSFPAISEDVPAEFPPSCTVEPDWRAPGEALCPERYSLTKLKKIAKRVGSYFWNALFQQSPRAREGSFFKREWFTTVKVAPAIAERLRFWDLAASSQGDYTVGTRWAMTPDKKRWYIEDVVRGQWTPYERDKIILETARADGIEVEQRFEQEPGSAGKAQISAMRTLLQGFTVTVDKPTGSKVVRAGPVQAQLEGGNILLVEAPWNKPYIEEMTSFPNGDNDDQVDTTSGGFNRLTKRNTEKAIIR